MFPSSPPTNPQHQYHHTQVPSIIRTRSQQGRPLTPVDLYASPLKKAMRNRNHSTDQTRPELKTENVMLRDITENDTREDMSLSPSHKKRASSPSFARNDNAGKRTRVLVQSSRINSIYHGVPEEPLRAPHGGDPTTPVKPSLRAVSDGSPGKGLIHMDLTKVPSSPSKPSGSPTKTFEITKDDGYTMRVPITPVRRPILQVDEIRTGGPLPCDRPSAMEEQIRIQPPLSSPAAILVQPSTHVLHPSTPTLSQSLRYSNNTIRTQSQSIPVRSPGKGLLSGQGSPLTPLKPNGSTPSRKPSIPFSIPCQGITSTARPIIPSTSSGLLQNSPSKSRIPLPSSSSLSCLPRPSSSSLSISTLPVEGPSSPVKGPSCSSPVKTKIRTKGKVKSPGVRSGAPLTRLAAKRRLRKTTSSVTGLRAGASSVGSSAPPSSSVSAEPSNAAVAAYIQSGTEKRSLVTSSLLSSENAPFQGGGSTRFPASSNSGSPKKPTPLTALSTALQKLMSTPPAAPLPRPRPNTSLGFAHSSLIPSQAPAPPPSKSQDDVHLDTQTLINSQNSVQRSKTLGHTQLNRMSTGVGKMGLPLRRPSTADRNRSSPWAGAPFASQHTTLSTVPASPSRSVVPTEAETTQGAIAEVLDVDAWAPPGRNDKSKEKAENEKNTLEYFVPLADQPRTKERGLLELVSPSRRASQASMLLSQSLSLPRKPTVRHQARSASASAAVQPIPRTPVKTRGRTRPPPPAPQPASDEGATTKLDDPMGGKRSNARMPGSLDVLKDCIIFVDVRTEEGEDAGALFVDMLRGLGARILAKPGKSCTHLVYKAGLPSTITRYKLLLEPRPLPVSIGWVVECVEKRAHVDETRFLVNLNEIGVAGGVQRRRSMQPKQMRTLTLGQLDNGEPADISVKADSSFTSEEPSTSGLSLANLSPPTRIPNNNLPPLERARQRSLRLPQE